MLNVIVFIVGILIFLWISWAVKYHFVADKIPLGMKLISVLSIMGIVNFCWLLSNEGQNDRHLIISLIFFIISALLFWRSILDTSSKEFRLAFDNNSPDVFVSNGIYKFIRHPFYASYIIFWIGCFSATAHFLSFLTLITLFSLYTISAKREEKNFAKSDFAESYKVYQNNAGLFWPKFSSLKKLC